MRTRSLQRPNRSEGTCVFAQRNQGPEEHKVPPAYSHPKRATPARLGTPAPGLGPCSQLTKSGGKQTQGPSTYPAKPCRSRDDVVFVHFRFVHFRFNLPQVRGSG